MKSLSQELDENGLRDTMIVVSYRVFSTYCPKVTAYCLKLDLQSIGTSLELHGQLNVFVKHNDPNWEFRTWDTSLAP